MPPSHFFSSRSRGILASREISVSVRKDDVAEPVDGQYCPWIQIINLVSAYHFESRVHWQ
jgi:hypothetical protein